LPGELTALTQTSWLDLRGPTSKGRGKERGDVGEKRGSGMEGKENGEGEVVPHNMTDTPNSKS